MKLTNLFQRNKQDEAEDFFENRDGKLIELSARLNSHRKKKRRTFLLIILLIVLFAALFFALYYRQSYSGYKVLDQYSRSDGGSGMYTEFNGCIVRYTADGISGIDHQGNEIWQQAYELQTPLTASCGDSLAVTEKEGNHIYIFSSKGKKGEITTPHPIQTISVSAQGIVAVVMRSENQALINCYDRNGTVLVESKASLAETGYPLAVSISEDGTRLLVSYVLSGDTVRSKVVCYKFGEGEKKQGDYTVMEETYDNLLISTVFFIGNYTGVAVGDGRIYFYTGTDKMKEKKNLVFTDEIASVVRDSENIGIVLRSSDKNAESKYTVKMLDKDGAEKMSVPFNEDYTSIALRGSKLILLNEQRGTIFTEKGRKIFQGNFDDTVTAVFPLGGLNRYFVIEKDSMQTIRLVK